MIATLKSIHVATAGLSILGFILRGFWAWRYPALLERKPVRILPHVVDTLLLVSAVTMLVVLQWNPFAFGWLTAKIGLLVVYIALGLVALKPWFGPTIRVAAFFVAVAVFASIVEIARANAVIPVFA